MRARIRAFGQYTLFPGTLLLGIVLGKVSSWIILYAFAHHWSNLLTTAVLSASLIVPMILWGWFEAWAVVEK